MTRLAMTGGSDRFLGPEILVAGDCHQSPRPVFHSSYNAWNVGDIGIEGGQVDISGGTYLGAKWTNVPGRWYYARAWMFPVAPEIGSEIIFALYHDTVPVQNFVIASDSTLHRDSVAGPSLAYVPSYSWVCFEIGVWCDHTTQRHVILRVNGVDVDNFITTNALNYPGNQVRFGIINPHVSRASGREIFIDDLALNDDTGTENNSWPGVAGYVQTSYPLADVAVGADWKDGAGNPPADGKYWWKYGNTGQVPPDFPQDQATEMISNSVSLSVDTADFRYESFQWEAVHMQYPGSSLDYMTVKVTSMRIGVSAARVGTASLQSKLITNPETETITINPPPGPPGYFPDRWGFGYSSFQNGSSIDPYVEPVVRINKLAGSDGIIYVANGLIQFEYEAIDTAAGEAAVLAIRRRFPMVT